MARSVHSYQAYIFAERKARQIWRGSYEAEGHIARQISADIRKSNGNITLTPTLFFIIMVRRYVSHTKADFLQVNRQLFSLVCWVMYAAENLNAIDESYKVYGFESAPASFVIFFLFRQRLTCIFTVKREKICFHSLNKKK